MILYFFKRKFIFFSNNYANLYQITIKNAEIMAPD